MCITIIHRSEITTTMENEMRYYTKQYCATENCKNTVEIEALGFLMNLDQDQPKCKTCEAKEKKQSQHKEKTTGK